MAEQRQQVLGRSGAQAEKLDKSTVGDTAARFYGESGIPVRNIAYGFDPGLPHGGIGSFDGLCSLFGGEAFPHLRHGTGKPRKTAPFGDRPQQIGEFEVTVGIDQPRSEHPGIKLGAGTPVGLGTRPDGEDTAVGRNPDPRGLRSRPCGVQSRLEAIRRDGCAEEFIGKDSQVELLL